MSQTPASLDAPPGGAPTVPPWLRDEGGAPQPPARRKSSDFIPAFLVKEIRQSLRSSRFMRSFLGLQVLLLAFTFAFIAGGLTSSARSSQIDGYFWAALAIPILLLPPLSIMMSMARIQKDRSLELVFLTSLSAWRAVIGMWVSHLCEALLLTLSALPYIVLRYYLGGVDLVQELLLFGLILVSAAVITGMTFGLSTYSHWFLRLIIVCVAGLFVFVTGSMIIWFGIEKSWRDIADWRWLVLLFGILPVWTWTFLHLCAGRLCPPSESHSAHLRIGILLILGLGAFCELDSNVPFTMLSVIFCIPLLTETLGEPYRGVSALYQPRNFFPWLSRLLGRFFYPGWPAGTNFVLVYFLACMAWLAILEDDFGGGSTAMPVIAGLAITLLGAAFIHRARKPLKDPSQTFFACVFVGQVLYAILLNSAYGFIGWEVRDLILLWAPAMGGMTAADSSDALIMFVGMWVYPAGAFIFGILLIMRARPYWRATRAYERGEEPELDNLVVLPGLLEKEE